MTTTFAIPGAKAQEDAKQNFSKTGKAGDPVQACPGGLSDCDPKILSKPAADRAARKYKNMSSAEQKKLGTALEKAKSKDERCYIWKAFAACHSPDECAQFADRIRGKSATWMQDNLKLTGSSTGKGVKQQWHDACNATTVQAVRGQIDPIYALQVHDENPGFDKVNVSNAMAENPKLASEQRDMLQSTYAGTTFASHAGVAVPRDDYKGQGRWADDLLNKQKAVTGVEYITDMNPTNVVAQIDQGLASGAPVPLVLGNQPQQYGHYVLVTSSQDGPPKAYTIHDPWEGKTVPVPAEDLANGNFSLAGWHTVTAIESPHPIPLSATGAPAC